MLVVADSSPLNFLVRMQCVDVLPTLFTTVLIPTHVADELSRPTTPVEVRDFIANPPSWLLIRIPSKIQQIPKLHVGELAAISLACEVKASLILLDDRDARTAAARLGLDVTGLLGVLERADQRGLLNLEDIARRLPEDYHIDPALVEQAVQRRRYR
ncbi:MAG: DUF3368 domain-containing protein [Phycisphaerae bacterium]|nr:DUF3368 domain-containing protein [Phycisphaerae bacterium]